MFTRTAIYSAVRFDPLTQHFRAFVFWRGGGEPTTSMCHFRFLILFPLVIAVPSLRAEPGLVVTLADVPTRVRSQNPDLAAARLRIDEAIGRSKQSGRLSNPSLDSSFEHNSIFREGRLEVGFSLRFPVTNRLSLEKQLSVTELRAAEAEVSEVERKLVLEARLALIQVLAIRRSRELLRQQSELSERFSGTLKDAAEKGEGSTLDAAQARLETASITVELQQLDAEEATAVGALKPLLGMKPSEVVHVSGTLDLPAVPKGRADLSRRPDLQVAQLDEVAADQGVALEKAKRYDDVEPGLFAAGGRSEDAPDGYDNEAIVGLRFKIPLPLWNKNDGAIEAAQARVKRKQLETGALARTIHREVETGRLEMEQWGGIARELGGTMIPLADEQVRLAEEAHAKAQGDLQTVFRLREKRLRLASSRLDALREFHLAKARHAAASGQP